LTARLTPTQWHLNACHIPASLTSLLRLASRPLTGGWGCCKAHECQEECQWALKPPTNVEGFVSGKIWAIARVGDTSDVCRVEKQRLDSLLLDGARSKYSEIAGFRVVNESKNAHQHQNRGLGVTKAQYIEATMDYMENGGIFVTRYDKWFDTAANVLQDDGSRIVSRLKQTCTPTGAARQWVTTVTDVMILNYAVGLDVTRDGTQYNTQGVWPCKLPIDNIILQILAMSPDLMRLAQTASSMFFMNRCSQETHDKNPSLMRVIGKRNCT